MQLCIFEDSNCSLLEPLIFYRPVYDLFCGMKSLREKILSAYPDTRYALHCRAYLEDFVKSNNSGVDVNQINDNTCLFINGKVLAPNNLSEIIPLEGEDRLYKTGDTVIAVRISGKKLENMKRKLNKGLNISDFENLPVEIIETPVIEYLWNLIYYNGKELVNDYKALVNQHTIDIKNNLLGKIYDGVHLVEKDNIFIAEGSNIKPGVVLDASNGPIYIDKNVKVFPNAVIEGPIYIGENSQIKSGATIYENVTIGQTCKIGGEVEDAIFLPFSNKQHSGFIGHAYVGSWVNIGADTNCSDLKNNYGSVKAFVRGKEVNTKVQFLGVIMGDHSKTAINTMFNTGTTVGFSCNIFGAGFPEKYIPSFSWGGHDSMVSYNVEKSIETAKKVLKRRNKEMNISEENLFREIFDLTKDERLERGYSN
jgi:UDP-N-acetylglucosamine diphosphorylase/glucosamine-1-phosphate N-acetyltransferase